MNTKKKIFIVLIFSFILIIFCSLSFYNQQSAEQRSDFLEIHVINVNQGDSFLIISPSGKKILIDAGDNGKGYGVVLPYLRNRGISTLDYCIACHYHADHIGGLDEVISGLGGSSKILIAAYDRGGVYDPKAFQDYAAAVGDKRRTIIPGETIDLSDGGIIKCIASGGWVGNKRVYFGTDENAFSVVLHLKYGHFDMYLGGDSNSLIEPYMASETEDVDIYKVSHHGSSTSSTQVLQLPPKI